jgi:HK97 family phage prohead protease
MELKKIYKSTNLIIKEKDEEKREIVCCGTKEVVDRDNDIVYVDGISLKDFKKNPVVLWVHKTDIPPVARAEKVWIDKNTKSLMFKLKFPEPEVSSFSDTLYKLMKEGFLNSFSIGFLPDYRETKFNDKRQGLDIFKSTLLELSIVPVPANQQALIHIKALESKVIDKIELDELNLYLNDIKEVNNKDIKDEETKKEVVPVVEQKTDLEVLKDIVVKLQQEIESLKSNIKNNETSSVEETGDLHIVDQLYRDIFLSSDYMSKDDNGKESENDDLNLLVNSIIGDNDNGQGKID